MQVFFDESKHIYTLLDEDGNLIKELPSVTTVLARQGLSTDFSAVNSDTLEKKAERGSLIHKEIQEFVENGAIGFTSELVDFVGFVAKLEIVPKFAERIVFNEDYAGTYDLLATNFKGENILIDHKTSARLNKEALAWQLGAYNYLGKLNCVAFYCFHLLPDGKSKIVEIVPKTQEQIEALFLADKNGETYKDTTLQLNEKDLSILTDCERQLAELKNAVEEIENRKKLVYSAIMSAMEENNTKSFETDTIKITYVDEQTRITVDTAKLKADLPKIAEKYAKTTKIKPSLRITLR